MAYSDVDIYEDFALATESGGFTGLIDDLRGGLRVYDPSNPKNAEFCRDNYKRNRAARMQWQREYYQRNREVAAARAAERYQLKKQRAGSVAAATTAAG